MTLAEFLCARLDEDEQVARAARPGPWRWDTSEGSFDGEPDPAAAPTWGHLGPDLVTDAEVEDRDVISSSGYDADSVIIERADADHIARHDPARVLAEVEAKRRLIHLVEGAGWYIAQEMREQALRLLALPHAGHLDYRQEWAP